MILFGKVGYDFAPEPRTGKMCWTVNNSTMHWGILLTFGRLMQYGPSDYGRKGLARQQATWNCIASQFPPLLDRGLGVMMARALTELLGFTNADEYGYNPIGLNTAASAVRRMGALWSYIVINTCRRLWIDSATNIDTFNNHHCIAPIQSELSAWPTNQLKSRYGVGRSAHTI